MSSAESIASNASVSNGLSMIMAQKAQQQMRAEGANAVSMIKDAANVANNAKPTASVSSAGRVDGYA